MSRSLLFAFLLSLAVALPDAPSQPTLSPSEDGSPPSASAPHITPFAVPEPELRRRAAAATVAGLDGYSYLGCYQDGSDPLSITSKFDGGMTPQLCRNLCSLEGCPIFGLGHSYLCHCGKTIPPFAVSAAEEECTEACAGDQRVLCGGGKRLNIYSATVGFEGLGASSPNGTGSDGKSAGGSGNSGSDGSSSGSGSNSSGSKSGDSDNDNDGSSDGNKGGANLSVGAIAGIAVGSACLVAILGGILACVFCLRRRKNKRNRPVVMPTTYQNPPPQPPVSDFSQQQQGPPHYGFAKANESSTGSPTSEPARRDVSPLVAGGFAPPPGPPPRQAHEMTATMTYEMPGPGYAR
jgi:hypothetical protein